MPNPLDGMTPERRRDMAMIGKAVSFRLWSGSRWADSYPYTGRVIDICPNDPARVTVRAWSPYERRTVSLYVHKLQIDGIEE